MLVKMLTCICRETGDPKYEHTLNSMRHLSVGYCAMFEHLELDKGVRYTTEVDKVYIVKDKITIYTKNTIYEAELLTK